MKTIGHLFLLLLCSVSACTSDDLNKSHDDLSTSNSFSVKSVKNQQPLDDYIQAIQKHSSTSTISEFTETFIAQSPLSNLTESSPSEITHLKTALVNATKSLITVDKKVSITKEQRCRDYEADIWWEVFWYMQSQPSIQMNEADVQAKEVSSWAYQACSCSQQIQ